MSGAGAEHVLLRIDTSGFIEALNRYAAAFARFYVRPDGRPRAVDVPHPKPLSIDGHAYHLRRRARARRNR